MFLESLVRQALLLLLLLLMYADEGTEMNNEAGQQIIDPIVSSPYYYSERQNRPRCSWMLWCTGVRANNLQVVENTPE